MPRTVSPKGMLCCCLHYEEGLMRYGASSRGRRLVPGHSRGVAMHTAQQRYCDTSERLVAEGRACREPRYGGLRHKAPHGVTMRKHAGGVECTVLGEGHDSRMPPQQSDRGG
jgi:hypothetical protein